MFNYGITIENARKIFPTANSFGNVLHVGNIHMRNFPCDCGAVSITGCNYATDAEIAAMLKIASLAGMSKIFGTIVLEDEKAAKQQKKKFIDAGFKIIRKGFSNRTSSKTDIVLFHYNPKPEKEGY